MYLRYVNKWRKLRFKINPAGQKSLSQLISIWRLRPSPNINSLNNRKKYLISERTLKLWSAKSIEEWVALFKQRYPYAHITIYKLRKFYKENKIKKKLVRIGKVLPERALPRKWKIRWISLMMFGRASCKASDWCKSMRQCTRKEYCLNLTGH